MFPDRIFRLIPDRLFIKLFYCYFHGKFPDLKNPRTFDEKLQWYKLNYKKPEMTMMTDKFEVRKYVTGKGLGHILNDLYFVKDKLEEKDFINLPESYVIKANHGCRMNIIKKSGDLSDIQEMIQAANRWLKQKHFYYGREWAYKNIKPRIIAEKYLINNKYGQLIDYKFFCYNGKPEVVFACLDRYSYEELKYIAYDMDWKKLNIIYKGRPGIEIELNEPTNFKEMKETAGILSGDYPFVRVDLYSVENKTVFGELTFYPDSGIIPFTPDKCKYLFGDFFKLPDKK